MDALARIERLFLLHARRLVPSGFADPVTPLDHALQCALCAEECGANAALVAAALLHDIGHFIDCPPRAAGDDDVHELRAIPFLAPTFDARVLEPIRLHVQAKRYFVAKDPRYVANLSAASCNALPSQGGPMSVEECKAFEQATFAHDALRLRRWDDAAKKPDHSTPPLQYYLEVVRSLALPVVEAGAIPDTQQ